MNLNEFFQAKSDFSHGVQIVRNQIAKKYFFSKLILTVSNLHDKLGDNVQISRQIRNMETRFIPMLQSSSFISKTIFYHTNQCVGDESATWENWYQHQSNNPLGKRGLSHWAAMVWAGERGSGFRIGDERPTWENWY